jgi:hypothetical protein
MTPAAADPAELAFEGRVREADRDIAASGGGNCWSKGDSSALRDHGEERCLAAQFEAACERDPGSEGGTFDRCSESVAAHREQERVISQSFHKGHRATPGGERMGQRQGEDDRLRQQGLDVESRIREGQDDDSEVRGVVQDACDRVVCAEHFDAELDAREFHEECGEGRREEVVDDRLGCAKGEALGGGAAFGDLGDGGGEVVQDAVGAISEAGGRFGCDHLAADAVEERQAEFTFEELELLADGWLRDEFLLGGERDAARPNYGPEVAELLKVQTELLVIDLAQSIS